jgi:hypothetical protein
LLREGLKIIDKFNISMKVLLLFAKEELRAALSTAPRRSGGATARRRRACRILACSRDGPRWQVDARQSPRRESGFATVRGGLWRLMTVTQLLDRGCDKGFSNLARDAPYMGADVK